MLNPQISVERRTADAVVIGGGVIGLAIARALRLGGVRRVTLLERGQTGREASHAAAGMLAPQVEADGPNAFLELACLSRDLYPAFADALRMESGLDIELERSGTLLLAFNERDESEALRRFDWQIRAGLSVERLTAKEAREIEPFISPKVSSALRFPRDWQVENRLLLAALRASAERAGVDIRTETEVESLRTEHGRVTGVETSRGPLSAPVVVVACGAWSSLIETTDKRAASVRIEPVRGQMLCFAASPRPARHVIYSPRGYVVPRMDGRLLAGSTTERAGYDKRVTDEGRRAILEQALEIAPGVGGLRLTQEWAGLRPRAEDDLPVLGPSAEIVGLHYATGHFRNGILLAPITGDIIAGLVTGERARVEATLLSAFSPGRFQLAGVN
jgi:glycine oxidase